MSKADASTYRVGILNSLSGAMSHSEQLVAKATQLAIAEINEQGGVLGRKILATIRDGESRAPTFAIRADELLHNDGIDIIFGCWTSSSRKALLPMLEKHNGLLFYPLQYEGLEENPHVIYTGSTLNQQVEPAIDWVMDQDWRNTAIIGSDYVYPRTANTLMHGILEKRGGTILKELYIPLEGANVEPAVKELLAAKPDVIFSTINGVANFDFFRFLAKHGPGSETLPVVSFSFSETELAQSPDAIGHYACWDYFSTCVAPVNKTFLPRIREFVGNNCPVSSPMANAYTQVYLWKAMVEDVGSFEVDALRKFQFVMVDGPCGAMELRQNHHVRKRAMIGQAQSNGDFEIVWQYPEMLNPEPWFGVDALLRGRIIHQALEAFPTVVDLHSTMQREKDIQEALIVKLNEKQKELEEALDAAQAADRAKSDFLAAMSHEIRTPMNGIIGMAQLLQDEPLSEGQTEQLRIILSSGESLLTIINDILDFSKIKAGKIELEKVGFSFHDLLSETLQLLAPKASARGMEIELDIELDMPDVRKGDPTRIRQVLLNLVSNAIKFTEKGRILVRVRPTSAIANGVCLQVQDDGIGISSEAQKNIFQPFVQADSGTTRQYGGTGLGLVICKRLIELMGGELTFVSVLGEGTTFTANFPLAIGQDIEVGDIDGQQKPPADLLIGKRVLLVDDNEINLRVAEGMLTRLGMKPFVASRYQVAKRIMEENGDQKNLGFDCMIFDAMMPKLDGWGLAEWVRKLPNGKDVPIIMASSAIGINQHPSQHLFEKTVLAKPLLRSSLHRVLALSLTDWQPQGATADMATKSSLGDSRRVLVVEDSLVNQKVAESFLTRGGHKVTVAENGQIALDLLTEANAFDLILMDVQMPELDGLEATRQIRQREAKNGWLPWPIIALTGNAMEKELQECVAAGMDRCLVKPMKMSEIHAIVAEVPSRR